MYPEAHLRPYVGERKRACLVSFSLAVVRKIQANPNSFGMFYLVYRLNTAPNVQCNESFQQGENMSKEFSKLGFLCVYVDIVPQNSLFQPKPLSLLRPSVFNL